METVGGQAVIEGVMMRSPRYIVTAVRKPDGKIVHRKEKVKTLTTKPFFRWPFIRGVVMMAETMVIGVKALNYSAQESGEEEGDDEKLSALSIVGTLLFALVFALAVFKLVPLGFAQLLNSNFEIFKNRYLFNLAEGVLKLLMFVGYIYIISRFKDIRRVFQYHGAEHKAVNCYEKDKVINLECARKHSTVHRRCGTSFMLFVIFLSFVAYIFLPIDIPFISKFILRISLLPVIAAFSYEMLKLSSRYETSFLINMFISPGLMLQRLTTSEPDDSQLEVAIHALEKSIEEEKEEIN